MTLQNIECALARVCVFWWVNSPKFFYYISLLKYQATGIILYTPREKKNPKRNNEPREEEKYNVYITTVQHDTITRGMNNKKQNTQKRDTFEKATTFMHVVQISMCYPLYVREYSHSLSVCVRARFLALFSVAFIHSFIRSFKRLRVLYAIVSYVCVYV